MVSRSRGRLGSNRGTSTSASSPWPLARWCSTPPDGRISRFPRAVARFVAADGRTGLGWIEWNQPQISGGSDGHGSVGGCASR